MTKDRRVAIRAFMKAGGWLEPERWGNGLITREAEAIITELLDELDARDAACGVPAATSGPQKRGRYTIYCRASGPFPSTFHGQHVEGWSCGDEGVLKGGVWSTDSLAAAIAEREILLRGRDGGAYDFQIYDNGFRMKGAKP